MPTLEIPDIPSFCSDIGSYPAYLQLVLDQFKNVESADWVLFNSFDKLEEQVCRDFFRRFYVNFDFIVVPRRFWKQEFGEFILKELMLQDVYGFSCFGKDQAI